MSETLTNLFSTSKMLLYCYKYWGFQIVSFVAMADVNDVHVLESNTCGRNGESQLPENLLKVTAKFRRI